MTQASTLRTAFCVVTDNRSVSGAKQMVYPQVSESGRLKRPCGESRSWKHVNLFM